MGVGNEKPRLLYLPKIIQPKLIGTGICRDAISQCFARFWESIFERVRVRGQNVSERLILLIGFKPSFATKDNPCFVSFALGF